MLLTARQTKYSFLGVWIVALILFYRSIRKLSFYQINDDFFLYGISSGALYGFSSNELIFISSPLNYLFKFAFEINSRINWYFEFYLVNIFSAVVLIGIHVFNNFQPNSILKGIIFLLINFTPILFLLKMFYLIQFSQVAIISAGAGLIIFLKNKNLKIRFFSIFLITLGFSWRSEAAILSIGLVLLVYFGFQLLNKDFTVLRNKSFISICVLIGVIFAVKSINFLGLAPWQTFEQIEFKKLNYDIMRTYDFSPNSEVRKLQKKTALELGWSNNDYLLYGKTYFADEFIYSNKNLDLLANRAAPAYNLEYFYKSLKELIELIRSDHVFIAIGIPIFLFTIFCFTRFSIAKTSFFYTFLFSFFIFLVYLLGKLPDRIFWPSVFIFLTSILIFFRPRKYEGEWTLKGFTMLLPIVVFVLISSFAQYKEIVDLQWWKSVKENKTMGFDRVLEFKTDKPIIAFSSFYSPLIQSLNPRSNEVEQIFKDMVYLNWATRSTNFNQHLDNLKLERNLFTSIAEGKAYLATSDIEELQMVNQYLIEHHGVEPIWDVAPFIFSDTGLGIWKIIGLK